MNKIKEKDGTSVYSNDFTRQNKMRKNDRIEYDMVEKRKKGTKWIIIIIIIIRYWLGESVVVVVVDVVDVAIYHVEHVKACQPVLHFSKVSWNFTKY